MSRPPINPDKTAAGIAVDPHTLERVIPESKRPDGTVRKQIKIRPGFTPQEDVNRFRGTRQAQMDRVALPKGHIIGWAPPPVSNAASAAAAGKPLSKSAKKNAKRKEKRDAEKQEEVPENWDDDNEGSEKATNGTTPSATKATKTSSAAGSSAGHTEDSPNWAAASPPPSTATVEGSASELKNLNVK